MSSPPFEYYHRFLRLLLTIAWWPKEYLPDTELELSEHSESLEQSEIPPMLRESLYQSEATWEIQLIKQYCSPYTLCVCLLTTPADVSGHQSQLCPPRSLFNRHGATNRGNRCDFLHFSKHCLNIWCQADIEPYAILDTYRHTLSPIRAHQ